MVTRLQRLRKEIRDGEGLERMAEMLYLMANDPAVKEADRVNAVREWRQVMKDLGARPAKQQGDVLDELAARRKGRRTA